MQTLQFDNGYCVFCCYDLIVFIHMCAVYPSEDTLAQYVINLYLKLLAKGLRGRSEILLIPFGLKSFVCAWCLTEGVPCRVGVVCHQAGRKLGFRTSSKRQEVMLTSFTSWCSQCRFVANLKMNSLAFVYLVNFSSHSLFEW